jgi:hypothetical protein
MDSMSAKSSGMAVDGGGMSKMDTSAAKQGISKDRSSLMPQTSYSPPPAGSMVKSVSAPKLGGGMRMGSFMLGGGGGMGLGRID